MQAITGAIHGAAGNRKGVAAAAAFSFHEKPPALASEGQIRSLVGALDGEGEFTMEQVKARAAEMKVAA